MSGRERSYLDHNATVPMRPEVAEAVVRATGLVGNPSSIHSEGRAARAAVEAARASVARLVGADPARVIFTSGGTEAANAVLVPGFRRRGEREGAARLLAGAGEHPCVLGGHRFGEAGLETILVDEHGIVDLGWLDGRLSRGRGERCLVSIQTANNETGVLQPVAEAARLVHGHGGLLHTDAVQAAGKIALDLAALGADALTLSAHKLGGPKGVGAIVLAADDLDPGERLIRGGGQERGHRAGTENVAGIVGFGVAADIASGELEREGVRLRRLRDACEAELRRIAPSAVVFGAGAERLPNTLAFAMQGVRAETALILFDLEGVALSSGSACSSGKVKPSHVLEAMAVPRPLAEGAMRVSLGWNSTEADVKNFAAACEKLVATLYKSRAAAA
jgi:cysteine desulfurase